MSTAARDWNEQGIPWTIDGDWVTIDNQDAGDNYRWRIHELAQVTAQPITIRVRAKGQDVAAPASNGFSIYMYGSYTAGGGTTDIEAQTQFPAGTWSEGQFEATINPAQPVTFLYIFVLARYKRGRLSVRDLEVMVEGGPPAKLGLWSSEPIDVARLQNRPIPTGGLKPDHVGLYYGNLGNVDNLRSVEHSTEVLSRYDALVIKEPGELTGAAREVQENLLAQGVRLWGYTATSSPDAVIQAAMDRMAAAGYHGTFIDEAGYDFKVTRARFNALVAYAHTLGLRVFANAWFPEDILTSTETPTYNPGGTATAMGAGDWILHESFYSRPTEYVGQSDGGFAVMVAKYLATRALASAIGVKVSGLSYPYSSIDPTYRSDRDRSYLLGAIVGLDGWSYGGLHEDNFVPWSELPDLPIGTAFAGAVTAPEPGRWERRTDAGVIWFEASDTPVLRRAGAYGAGDLYVVARGLTAEPFDAASVTLSWETSADGVTWTPITGSSASRLVRVTATLID